MVKSNIIKKGGEPNALAKMQKQLDHVQRISGEVEQRVAEARGILRSYCRKDGAIRYDSLNDMIVDAAKNSEYLTERLRRLTLELTLDTQKYVDYKNALVHIHGIEVEYVQEILQISMPVLIPHRKSAYTDYLYQPLYTALRNWCAERAGQGQEIPFFEKGTVCFLHCYEKGLPLGRVRDHDNIEEKHVLDVISNFFLRSDGGLYINVYHESRLEEEDGTCICVMKQKAFPEWLNGRNYG